MNPRSAVPRQPIFNVPPATKLVFAANVAVWLLLLVLPAPQADAVVGNFGFDPAHYHAGAFAWPALLAPFSYQFIHDGATHLFVNMLGLAAFGAGVEQRVGSGRFLIFYLVCGAAGAAAQFAIGPGADELLVGASASVSGLFGAVLRFPAFRRNFWLLVILWLVLNAVTGWTGLGSPGEPVAWIAHVGGFAAGLVLFPLFLRLGRPPGSS